MSEDVFVITDILSKNGQVVNKMVGVKSKKDLKAVLDTQLTLKT